MLRSKTLLSFLLAVTVSPNALAGSKDTLRAPLLQISYHSLDSLIRSNEYTAIYFWPSWCLACAPKIPPLLDVMRQKKSITFISINDPDCRPVIVQVLRDNTDVVKGAFRMERYGRKKAITINDRSQQRYFNWYYTRSTDKRQIEQIRRFLLFDKSGKLLYASSDDYLDHIADSVGAALRNYH